MLKKIILSFFLGILTIHAHCQEKGFTYQHYGIEHGLMNSSVTSFWQDKYGMMWIGTHYGLHKFDGYDFTVYTNNSEDSCSISENHIWDISADKDGLIWIGTTQGLNKLDFDTQRFSKASKIVGKHEAIGFKNVAALDFDKQGNLWTALWSSGAEKHLLNPFIIQLPKLMVDQYEMCFATVVEMFG